MYYINKIFDDKKRNRYNMYKEILGGDTDGTAAHVLTEQLSGKSLT